MDVSFNPKYVWKDLAESKFGLISLSIFLILMILCDITDTMLHIKICSCIIDFFIGCYFVLMINNIVKDTKPVLEDLTKKVGIKRYLTTCLKIFFINAIYFLIICAIAGTITGLLVLCLNIDLKIASFIMFFIILFLFTIASFSQFLYGENLSFKAGFNIKRAIKSFIIAWKEYLILLIINLFLLCGLVLLTILNAYLLGTGLHLLISKFPAIANLKIFSMTTGIITGSTIGSMLSILIMFWYFNIMSKIYKYSITKIDEQKVEQSETPSN